MSLGRVLYLTAVKKWWQSELALIGEPIYHCVPALSPYMTEKGCRDNKSNVEWMLILNPLSHQKIFHEALWKNSEIIQRCWLTFHGMLSFCPRLENFKEVDPSASFGHRYLSCFGWREQEGSAAATVRHVWTLSNSKFLIKYTPKAWISPEDRKYWGMEVG